MLMKKWLSHLESIKIQYLTILKKSKEFMFNVSYLLYSALLTRLSHTSSLICQKVNQGVRLNFHKLIKICSLARDCATRQLLKVNKVNI